MFTDTVKAVGESLQQAVVKHLHAEIERIVAEEAEAAAKRTRERVAKLSGEIAAKIVAATDWRSPYEGTVDFVIRLHTK